MNIKEKILSLINQIRQNPLPRHGRIRVVLILIVIIFLVSLCVHKRKETSRAQTTAAPTVKIEPVPKSVVAFLLSKTFDSTLVAAETLRQKDDTLSIQMTIDDQLQKRINLLMARYKPRCGAAIVLKPMTGEVLAAVSYRNEGEKEFLPECGNMLFWNEYPAASLFKIVTAAGAMEYGLLNPDDELKVTGSYYTLYKSQLSDRSVPWARRISIREAFSKSVNPLFGMVGQKILGSDRLNKTAARFLFNQAIHFDLPVLCSRYVPPQDDYETAERACGFNISTTISPLHAVLISGAIAAGGSIKGPYLVESVKTGGRAIYRHGADTTYNLVSGETSLLTRAIMSDVIREGTARKGFKDLKRLKDYERLKLGGKTGSIDAINPRGRCDWFTGFALDPDNPGNSIAMAVVTVHGAFWTVHSSYIAAEAIRCYYDKNRKKQVRF
jgi:penicillin-binding protein A